MWRRRWYGILASPAPRNGSRQGRSQRGELAGVAAPAADGARIDRSAHAPGAGGMDRSGACAREALLVPVQPGEAHELARAAFDIAHELLVGELQQRERQAR